MKNSLVSLSTTVKAAVIASATLALAGPIQAANQGTQGAQSNGDSSISMEKGTSVMVSAIDDVYLGSFDSLDPGTWVEDFDGICVFSSNTTYRITFEQNGAFFMEGNLLGQTLPYEVMFQGNSAPIPVSPGLPVGGQLGNNENPDCAGIENASYGIRVYAADFNAVPPDTYSAVLDIMVEPE